MLSDRQQQIWNYLVEYVDSHGYPPTVREIGEEVGLASPSTVHAHLANLERAGLLRRDPTKPRALELIGRERAADLPDSASVRLPLVGDIAAGAPLLAEQNIEEYMTFPSSCSGDFLLRIRGESMIEAGILDGDLVIVKQSQEARNGDIVAVLAGDDESTDEATVKTFYRAENGRIRLQPENSALQPIYADYVKILGKVVGVFREL
jgi:repressor LexA